MILKSKLYIQIILALCMGGVLSLEYRLNIIVEPNDCYNETCYNQIEDYANSPLVECVNLSNEFYECDEVTNPNSTANCTKWGGTKYSDVETTYVTCRIFDGIECRGNRTFQQNVPCIKYTDKYFISTVLYSIFLGLFAVDRFCIGHSGIGVGKLITLGGLGVWWLVDIILLVLGIIKPSDDSNWIPFF